jgi:hypothetical protein
MSATAVPPQTADKLNEARYFLDEMARTEGKEEFRYNVSAFLSAARSVKDTLKREIAAHVGSTVKKIAKDDVEKAMAADREMELLTEKRDTSNHVGGLELVEARMEEVPWFPYSADPGVSEWLRRRRRRTQRSHQPRSQVIMPGQMPPTISEPRWFFSEIKNRDAYTVCAQHLGKIDQAVVTCVQRFMI